MTRPNAAILLPCALLLALLPSAALAQVPAVFGLCRTDDGRPAADAEVLVQGPGLPDLPVLADWSPDPFRSAARTDAGGGLRVATPGPVSVLVRLPSGLGGVEPWAVPGAPFRLALAPMAELTAGQGEIGVFAAVEDGVAGRVMLHPLQGQKVRLPAGAYQLWIQNGDRWLWLRTRLRAGEKRILAFGGEARELALGSGRNDRVTPVGWPHVTLLSPERPRTLLQTPGPIPLAVTAAAGGIALTTVPEGERSWQSTAPAATGSRVLHVRGIDGPGQEVWVLRPEGDGFQPTARVRPDDAGRVEVPVQPDDWVLVLAAGCAPRALPAGSLPADGRLLLDRGRPLRLQCLDPAGGPASMVALELVPLDAPLATQRLRTDERGLLTVAQAPAGPLRLAAVDPRFANDHREIGGDVDAVTVTLQAGAGLDGVVREADGSPVAGVAVTLRDPRGALRPVARSVVTDAEGRFAFGGLPEGGAFVLFAQQERDGRTWSGRLSRARPGAPTEVVIRCEDPALPTGPTGR